MYCNVEAALDVICSQVQPIVPQAQNYKDADSGYLDPVSLTCPSKYHDHMTTRPFGQARFSRSMFWTCFRW